MTIKYYGKKSAENLRVTSQILPNKKIDRIIEACFGSGSFTRHVSCEKEDIQRVAYEKERALYTLHSVIKDEQKVRMLQQVIPKIENSKDMYLACEEIVKNYNLKKKEYEDVMVALAELVIIYFSMNSARNSWRNNRSYEKKVNPYARNNARIAMDAIEERFHNQLPGILYDLHVNWSKVDIINKDFQEDMETWCQDSNTFAYMDVPYLLDKRGRDDEKKKSSKKKVTRERKLMRAGYLEDWTTEMHLGFISKIIALKDSGKLKASLMICSNFEVDDEGYLIGVADDPYTELMKIGFRMVVTERKYTSAISEDKEDGIVKAKKCKVEVVYINYYTNYEDIVGNWENFEFFEYDDVLNGNVRISRKGELVNG